ncbi:HAAS signaling domain-containing protein [Georgenia sp. SUBG003]|uniref:HAAS signaling domain-containing protein n=1 Tax=Georgenia sp. SUBG003 TaxID=1497974 RepID=UPI0004D80DF4|nr:hypothetical protein DA06_07975 [Georgenia sp. SUBG003]
MSAADARVTAYLDDVARMLANTDPWERAEILAELREHIDAALADLDRPADDAVERVLAQLGPADRVAVAALTDPGTSSRRTAVTAPPALARPWVPVTVGLLTALSAGLYLVVLAASVALAVTQQPEVVPPAEVQSPMLPASYDVLWSMLVPLGVAGLPWLVSTILLASSPLWTDWQKWAGALLVPALAVTCGAVSWLGAWGPASAPRSVLAVAVGLAAAAAAVRLVVTLWRDGARRARGWRPAAVAV